MPETFDHILNWRLLQGGHEFPGPDGGTCINEAAIVAAGLPYRAINDASDCPPCFSRVLAEYALILNDKMEDGERQSLMPFVLRLSGSADTEAVETQRYTFMLIETVRRILAPVADAHWLHNAAEQCRSISIVEEVDAFAMEVAEKLDGFGYSFECARQVASSLPAERKGHRRSAIRRLGLAADRANKVLPSWTTATSILDDALKIGRQAPPLDIALAGARMGAARRSAPAESSL